VIFYILHHPFFFFRQKKREKRGKKKNYNKKHFLTSIRIFYGYFFINSLICYFLIFRKKVRVHKILIVIKIYTVWCRKKRFERLEKLIKINRIERFDWTIERFDWTIWQFPYSFNRTILATPPWIQIHGTRKKVPRINIPRIICRGRFDKEYIFFFFDNMITNIIIPNKKKTWTF